MKSHSTKRYLPELRERAVRMLLEHRDEYDAYFHGRRSLVFQMMVNMPC